MWYPHHNEVAAKEQGKLAVKGPMKVILKTLGGKGSKLSVDASETVEVLKFKAAKKLGGTAPCHSPTFTSLKKCLSVSLSVSPDADICMFSWSEMPFLILYLVFYFT